MPRAAGVQLGTIDALLARLALTNKRICSRIATSSCCPRGLRVGSPDETRGTLRVCLMGRPVGVPPVAPDAWPCITYRPATFAEVSVRSMSPPAQLMPSTAAGSNHAYLFSGPRGCGKTSSARIRPLAQIAQGPTSTPLCGACSSCVALPGPVAPVSADRTRRRQPRRCGRHPQTTRPRLLRAVGIAVSGVHRR